MKNVNRSALEKFTYFIVVRCVLCAHPSMDLFAFKYASILFLGYTLVAIQVKQGSRKALDVP